VLAVLLVAACAAARGLGKPFQSQQHGATV